MKYISIADAVKITGESRRTLFSFCASGAIPDVQKIGGKGIYILPEEWALERARRNKSTVSASVVAEAAGVSRQAVCKSASIRAVDGRIEKESAKRYIAKREDKKMNKNYVFGQIFGLADKIMTAAGEDRIPILHLYDKYSMNPGLHWGDVMMRTHAALLKIPAKRREAMDLRLTALVDMLSTGDIAAGHLSMEEQADLVLGYEHEKA